MGFSRQTWEKLLQPIRSRLFFLPGLLENTSMATLLVVTATPEEIEIPIRHLTRQGYEVTVLRSAAEALKVARAVRPDVVLLELRMPEMDGIEVCRGMRATFELEATPIIMLTVGAPDDGLIESFEAGADDFLSKPLNEAILAARIRSALRAKRNYDTILLMNQHLRAEIDRRERLEQEAIQAQRWEAIGRLAAGIAHEVSTPLQYIGDNLRFMQKGFEGVARLSDVVTRLVNAVKQGQVPATLIPEVERESCTSKTEYPMAEICNAIRQSLVGIDHLDRLMRAIRDCACLETKEKVPTDLNQMIQSVLTISRNQWDGVAKVVVDLDPHLPLVRCVPGELSQAILNLVTNAAQAMADVDGSYLLGKGAIAVRTRCRDGWAEICVEDSDTGIPDEIRFKVFDPFFTTRATGKSTGLGLFLARTIIVDRHNGTIGSEPRWGKERHSW
jgi:signal transduction histidine kinase